MSQCKGIKIDGSRCSRTVRSGEYCHDHLEQALRRGTSQESHEDYDSALSRFQRNPQMPFLDANSRLWRTCENAFDALNLEEENVTECKIIFPISSTNSRRTLCSSCFKRQGNKDSRCITCSQWFNQGLPEGMRRFHDACPECRSISLSHHLAAVQGTGETDLTFRQDTPSISDQDGWVQNIDCIICGNKSPYNLKECIHCGNENWQNKSRLDQLQRYESGLLPNISGSSSAPVTSFEYPICEGCNQQFIPGQSGTIESIYCHECMNQIDTEGPVSLR